MLWVFSLYWSGAFRGLHNGFFSLKSRHNTLDLRQQRRREAIKDDGFCLRVEGRPCLATNAHTHHLTAVERNAQPQVEATRRAESPAKLAGRLRLACTVNAPLVLCLAACSR